MLTGAAQYCRRFIIRQTVRICFLMETKNTLRRADCCVYTLCEGNVATATTSAAHAGYDDE